MFLKEDFVVDQFNQLKVRGKSNIFCNIAGLMVYDSKKLACHYLRSRAFLLDLTALCPVDLLQLRFGTNPLMRFPRFLKVSETFIFTSQKVKIFRKITAFSRYTGLSTITTW